jgi:hypothetical protein
MLTPPASSPPTDLELLCPACGYDLRAATSDLCPECGLAVERDSLKTSGFPWPHRAHTGRLSAYLKTFWLVTIDAKSLRHEPARTQDPQDARRFARLTAFAVAAGLLALFACAVGMGGGWVPGGLPAFAVQPSPAFNPPQTPAWLFDIIVPWSAGAVLPPVLPVAILLFALALVAIPRAVFRVPDPDLAQQNASAIASYATAPLALLLPAFAAIALIPLFDHWARDRRPGAWHLHVLTEAAGAIALVVCLIATPLRLTQWLHRTRRAGLARALLALAELLALWTLAALLFLFFLPWSVGYTRILIDSFR